ncbi:MAG: protein kinase [Planctomycetes bacterium]|nr:protein kinase [Planctomycetota bacterium]
MTRTADQTIETKKNPWEYRWTILEKLNKGGQGHTYIVKDNQNGPNAVLKELRNNKSEQARGRMAIEVIHLKALHMAGAKVPQVIDGNSNEYENPNVKLYFVMELVSGDELAKVVTENDGLSLESSLAIACELCKTIEIGIAEGIHHRDLKPENIIVSSLEPADIVIVDYGLSFNEEEETELTKHSETIESPFLTLPERRIPGGNRRDPRSDLAAICGVLFYCITVQKPALLEPPPHRRPGGSVQEKVNDKAQVQALEALLDRGLAPDLDDRFQNVAELVGRLEGVAKPRVQESSLNPTEFAQQVGKKILKLDRTSQISKFAECAHPVMTAIKKEFQQWQRVIDPFEVTPTNMNNKLASALTNPKDVEEVAVSPFRFDLKHKVRPFIRAVVYNIYANGSECGLFRVSLASTALNPQQNTFVKVGEWENVYWWNGLAVPDTQIAMDDFKASLIKEIALVEESIIQGH